VDKDAISDFSAFLLHQNAIYALQFVYLARSRTRRDKARNHVQRVLYCLLREYRGQLRSTNESSRRLGL